MSAMVLAMILSVGSPPAQATSSPAGTASEIRQILERALKQYETARSYEDQLLISSELDGDSRLKAPEDSRLSLAFVRPNKLLLGTPVYRVVSDGRKLWECVDVWMQYSEASVPSPLKLSDVSLSRFTFFNDVKHPLAGLIVQADRASLDLCGESAQWETIRPEPMNGAPGKRVTGTVPEATGDRIPVEIWLDDATGLIGEVVYDRTGPNRAKVARYGMKINRFVQRLRFTHVRINSPIADERFAFNPEPYFDKVPVLKMPSSREMQQRLIGKPAPAFAGKDLDGREAGLDDFKGRVLLLDFWSLRCAPCIISMPTLQRLADKYADKPVSILGVNLDGPPASKQVAELLKNRKISFRQLIESRPPLGEKYFIEGIPCTAMIDGKGIIQAIHMGMANERYLSGQIDRLLKGENLFSSPGH